MPTVVIVNPAAGAGRAGRELPALRRALEAALGPLDVRVTAGRGDAATLARHALESGARRIVAAGGDGTFHEVANGWFRDGRPVAPDATLGLIPCGTGSDLARTLGLPRDPVAAAAALAGAAPRALDVGRFRSTAPDGRRREGVFVNNLGFGIGGLVGRIANESPKWLGGFATFFVATVRAFQIWRDRRVRLTLDGAAREASVTLCSIANGRMAGGGMVLAPDASPFDGALDVAVLEHMRLHDFVGRGRYLYGGLPLRDPRIARVRVRVLRAEAIDGAGPVPITADGEDGGALPVEVEILPGALRILA